jgi:hypothetical protein
VGTGIDHNLRVGEFVVRPMEFVAQNAENLADDRL